MFAFPAAKRTLVLMMSFALVVSVSVAQAGEDQEKGYLGVMLQDLTPSMAKALQMGDKSGVMVNEVVDDSPASKAGLEDGDVILEFNGETISDNDDLVKAVRGTSPGENIEIVVLRNGKNKTLDVEIGKREAKNVFFLSEDGDSYAPHVKHFEKDGNKVIVMSGDDEDFTWTMGDKAFGLDLDRGYMGVHLDNLNEQMGEYFGVEGGKGALVTEVVEDSPAAAAGLKAGDVIVKMGENDIKSSEALHKAMGDTKPEQQMAIKVMRKGKSKDVSITLGDMPEDPFTKHIEIIGEGDDHWSIHTAPRMMKHFGHHGDVDVRVIRRGAPEGDFEWHEMNEAEGEIKEMREELDKMREDLKEMKKELKK
jgi:membrane-associated protease RseP (regulator of RpoE activity)